MTIDATFWVAVSFFIFFGGLVYLKIPQKINKSLTDQIKELTSHSKEQDKKLSNFLSTQLNTQASILQFTSDLSKNGLMDKETKKILNNIDRGIQQLKPIIKKK